MKAYGDTNCKLCESAIADGKEYEELRIHGKYHSVCLRCYNQIYNQIADVIIKIIKE